MLILVGLGNPGSEYARHRHNVGYMAVDAIADLHGFGPARTKFQSEIREGRLSSNGASEKALIVKPTTFMNESGRAVRAAMDFYKTPIENIVVFYDELDLAPGKLRAKVGGGAAGHNGIRSLDTHIGNAFRRVRIGIGHPGDKSRVTGHVLGNFAADDKEWLQPILAAIAHCAPFLLVGDQRFTTAVAQKLQPASPSPPKKETSADAPKNETAPPPAKSSTPFSDALKNMFGKGDKD
ncbi:MAG: aminoacyl-tRNA hydrolase [Pseudomonadota bacterium]